MFISLKWKAFVFLSMVLISITSIWAWQYIHNQLRDFDLALERSHREQTDLLNELIEDSFLRLSQFSELISGRLIVQQSPSNSSPEPDLLQASLEQDWISFNVSIGLDYLAIYNAENLKLAEVKTPDLITDQNFQLPNLLQSAQTTRLNEPARLIYCKQSCQLIVIQQFIGDQGKPGTMVLAQNMAEIVRVFHNFSNSGLGVMVSGQPSTQQMLSDRYLPDWKMYAWAVSDFERIFPVIKKYAESNSGIRKTGDELFDFDKRKFLISEIDSDRFEFSGEQALLISVKDKTASYDSLSLVIERALATIGSGLLIAEIFLLLLVNRPMKKIEAIAGALHLLPEQKFSQAADQIKPTKSLISDELSILSQSAVYVAQELDKLHQEVHHKNLSLEQQIHALTRSRSFLTRLFDNAQIFIITQDADFNILSTNIKFDGLYEKTPPKFTGIISNQHELEDFKKRANSLLDDNIEAFQQELHSVDPNQLNLIITWTHTQVEDEQGQSIILSIGMDQTRQKAAEKELHWMAHNDGLTSIGNRRSFNDRIHKMFEAEMSGALVFIDVNRFKQINDIYGHSAGDQVLIDIANRLKKQTRASDSINRFAGDEFTILMEQVSEKNLPLILDKLSNELNNRINLDCGKSIHYSVSIGACLFPEHANDPQSLITNADMAMYRAKKKGIGHWYMFESSDSNVSQLKQDHSLLLTIKHALENDLFTLVCQPILDIESSQISHYEILIRLEDESGNMISPGLFIPLAEKMGEIRNIDSWVLNQALSALSDGALDGNKSVIAINISAPTMQMDEFPEMVFQALKKHQVEPENLIIELTETALIDNFQQVLSNLSRITSKGVKVALDDFGVGFSSFTYLKMLPLSFVKLDGSYIENLAKNPDDQVFVKSLSAMVKAFGMNVVAEYVTNEDTLKLIAELGVTHGQGHFLGKPIPFRPNDFGEGARNVV